MKFNKRRVLIAPLDWGLGHATRCIPVIRTFRQLDWDVIIATDGACETLLRQEFPELQFITLKGYEVEYSSRGWMLPFRIAAQVPSILSTIRYERQWLQREIENYQVDLVISDNRFGLYSDKVPCVFITHQLQIKAPFRWMENQLRRLNFKYISQFTECWVPDTEINSLGGALSHLSELHPFPIHYIGPLSRFRKQMAAMKYKYAFLISGPEPQRSIFEQKIFAGVDKIIDPVVIIRGKPGDDSIPVLPSHVTVLNHADGDTMERILNASEIVISRAGYTTIMEVAALQLPAVLVPTPGQTEQEYLAGHLSRQRLAFSITQRDFILPGTLHEAALFNYEHFAPVPGMLQVTVEDFMDRHFEPQRETSFAGS